ncbi:acetylornithine transaminase [Nesterenkonia aerolata]|uniref:Acetylornithine transaminase n=1 Tax=Nesterenkonia aerolata TaxID=3074079 RepID=A0ABU2DSU3_9MICC|nr:acetylornithine transaminase [Nesterenkonia sp. LY-0111]MDR8019451.1 acetylornithine transaminase [Nesterenkonia sp. LY-0111]
MTQETTTSTAPVTKSQESEPPEVGTQGAAAAEGMESLSWQQRYTDSVMGVFGSPQQLLVSGSGCRVTDAEGRELLDMLGGIAVNALGHAHPGFTEGLTAQLNRLGHISNLFTSAPQIGLAEDLLRLAEAPAGSTVFFANSGSEANEAALKAVLKYRAQTGRSRILALTGGFHGRTVGAVSLTHKPAYREPFGPLLDGVEFLAPNDLEALEAALSAGDIAGIFLEPIQGEAGVRPLSPEYLAAVRRLTREHGTLMILDEVQTGVGRTGDWFRFQGAGREVGEDLTPDYMTLAKGLGSGVPIGALLAFGPSHSARLSAGEHGTTFGGNPLAATAGRLTLAAIESQGLLENTRRVGAQLAAGLRQMEPVAQVRQFGLHLGVDLRAEAPEVVRRARRHGLVLNATGPDTLRLAPPLILSPADADEFLTRFAAVFDDHQEPR